MKILTKENILDFIHYYHAFHDSYITNINYSINKKEIEILFDITWSGDTTLKDDKNLKYACSKTIEFIKEI